MNRVLLAICSMFYVQFTTAQFGPVIYTAGQGAMETVTNIRTADFNNDGIMDMITSSRHFPRDTIRLYTGLGNGQYNAQAIIVNIALTSIESLELADINKDGWIDFAIVQGAAAAKITWYENNGGSFTEHLLAGGLDFPTALILGDFDNNGFMDILALEHVEIVLYRQLAAGAFASRQVIHGGSEFYAIDAGYFNDDTLLDVTVASGGFETLINTGNGNFSLHSQVGISICFGLESADLDNDGDIDVAAYETVKGILFYANDGNGDFALRDTILLSTDNFRIFGFADLDCDHDPDLYTSITQLNRVVWVMNEGNGQFSLPQTIHTQPGQLIKATHASDLDADGKKDIIWGYSLMGFNINQNFCPACIRVLTTANTGANYQWQVNNGTGYTPISDDAVYSGTQTNQLKMTSPPTIWYGNKYRCIINGMVTAEEFILTFSAYWTGDYSTAWENPANWLCAVMPDAYTDVTIFPHTLRFPTVNNTAICRSLNLKPATKLRVVTTASMHIAGH